MSRIRQTSSGRAWPITALAKVYPRGWHVARHRHRRGQLIYAKTGVMQVTTREGIWIVPPQRALWIPVGMLHEIHMEGQVAVRMLYLDAPTSAPFGPHCRVLSVASLLRELILAAVSAHEDKQGERMAMLAPLLLHELQAADEMALHIPVPSDPRLRKVCQRLLAGNVQGETLEQLAARAGASSRTLARLFERELHMSFVRWRQHVRLARAVSQMSLGRSIKTVARDAGYASSSAFIDMFRRVLGVTPTDYLRYAGPPSA
ncbi:AraC family transcriptional regulator [Frateuria terrea]|uniref:AraC-type DNA-binding protein n=1 Tax=Frateuria terrea TaxID=529704 RepID=A0A1H6XXL6_9GAMM|nr:helix-turn-helix transcriptional regulator [Frateuria terrea]SEJ32374.1 AraC-type DNA-binding protein [Frateuria terrea]SFP51527.1 AraC-type DNA-binding protein [Frateuria terrea]